MNVQQEAENSIMKLYVERRKTDKMKFEQMVSIVVFAYNISLFAVNFSSNWSIWTAKSTMDNLK